MKRALLALAMLGVIGAGIGWMLTAPKPLSDADVAAWPKGDMAAGERVFWAAGCASCHAAPKAQGEAKLVLSGGHRFPSPFGTFVSPNISSHPERGIGTWTLAQFASAMRRGVSPQGAHYYPVFPYTSYIRSSDKDVADLYVFMKSLPQSDVASLPHEVGFPFNIRRGLGLWKLLYLKEGPALELANASAEVQRGQYLVEALSHCGACHTPRNVIGGPNNSRWLAGAVGFDNGEKIPNITPHGDGIGDWSAADIAESLNSGFTPEFDSFGSSMADVQENLAKLTDADRAAIAAYMKAIPAKAGKPGL